MDDKLIETWMGQVQSLLMQQNRLVTQHNTLIEQQNKKLGQLNILLGAGARVPVVVETPKPTGARPAPTEVSQACPACGHIHKWALYPDTPPGQHYTVRGDPEVIDVKAFIATRMCDKCDTPLTTVVHEDRAQKPVVSVEDMYGLKDLGNKPAPTQGKNKKKKRKL